MTDLLPQVLEALDDIAPMMADFAAICDAGGRFAGTASEKAAVALLRTRIEALFGRPPAVIPCAYDGWCRKAHRLERLAPSPQPLDCISLVWSPATAPPGLEAEVVDLGRGAPDEIRARGDELRGRIALVRHEYMFTENTMHRRYKYEAAREVGAAGFLIASHLRGVGLVTGSSGRNRAEDIPAAAISAEAAEALAPTPEGYPRVRLTIDTAADGDTAESLLLELPGRSDEWVVLSAHIDGHPLAESAMDNATGLAVALHVACTVAPHVALARRGLRLMLFNVEEWGLWGSSEYVDGLSEAERDRIVLNVNLDSVAGDPHLTAITSGYPKLGPFLRQAAARAGVPLAIHDALMRNSDHYNFARHGIPAFRLVAGFDSPDSNLRYVLTPGDTRDRVSGVEMRSAAQLAAAVVVEAIVADSLDLRP